MVGEPEEADLAVVEVEGVDLDLDLAIDIS
jgi:hypothetical protein